MGSSTLRAIDLPPVPPTAARSVALWAAVGVLALGAATLAGLGSAVRRRARSLAAAHDRSPVRPPPMLVRTGIATHLAWTAGAAVALAGGILVHAGSGAGAVVTAAGALVAVAGGSGRVASISTDAHGFEVRRSVFRPTRIAWAEVVAVDPPILPFGGWRIRTTTSSLVLMPSDLIGNDPMLGWLATRAAGRR